MPSPIKYSFELLETFCLNNGIKLAKDYSIEKLFE